VIAGVVRSVKPDVKMFCRRNVWDAFV